MAENFSYLRLVKIAFSARITRNAINFMSLGQTFTFSWKKIIIFIWKGIDIIFVTKRDILPSVWLKFYGWGQGWWHLQNPHPPPNNICLYPPLVSRYFWKDPLMTPTPPPHFKHLSLLPPSPSTIPPPPKNWSYTKRAVVQETQPS